MKNDNLFRTISFGVIAGFTGQYIGDVIYSVINNDEKIFELDLSTSFYIAGIVTGGVSAMFSGELSLFSSVLLSVIIFYSVIYASNEVLNDSDLSNINLLKDVIIDSILIYILLTFQDTFINLFINKKEYRDELLYNIVTGLIVTSYYSVKSILNN